MINKIVSMAQDYESYKKWKKKVKQLQAEQLEREKNMIRIRIDRRTEIFIKK